MRTVTQHFKLLLICLVKWKTNCAAVSFDLRLSQHLRSGWLLHHPQQNIFQSGTDVATVPECGPPLQKFWQVLQLPFSNFFPYPSPYISSYYFLFLQAQLDLHSCLLASKFKAHCLMLYYAGIQVQQWKYDVHNPFLWKHHPQLKLPANHLQVCL